MTNASKALTALGDPRRRELFERLGQRPMAVSELAKGLPVSRPAVSQHLKVLREAGLVRAHQEGTRRVYEIDPRGIAIVRAYLDRFWTQALDAFKHVVERPASDSAGGIPSSTDH